MFNLMKNYQLLNSIAWEPGESKKRFRIFSGIFSELHFFTIIEGIKRNGQMAYP